MNANVALLEPAVEPLPARRSSRRSTSRCSAREGLLAASARASRLLLEAPDVRGAIPRVLGLIGEAAHVDRVNLMQTRSGPERRAAAGRDERMDRRGRHRPRSRRPARARCDERNFSAVCAELRAGRSVCFSKGEISHRPGVRPPSRASAPRPRRWCRSSSPANSSVWWASTTPASARHRCRRAGRARDRGRRHRRRAASRAAGR